MSVRPERPEFSQGKVLVTGGTGHVGNNLVRRLLDEGEAVRCLTMPGESSRALDGLDVERVEGDLRDATDVARAVQGCERIFHVAAKISTLNATAGEQRDLFDINVMGTRHVMRTALEHGVRRVVLTGSFSATGYDPEHPSDPSDDSLPFYPFEDHMPYARTKMLAEHETLKAVVEGLDAVVVTSCACIGPHDFFPSRMGRTMCDFAVGKVRAYVDGGFDFVNANDIVDGHVRAMRRGRTGQKYICSTQFHTLAELVGFFREATGSTHRVRALPAGVVAAMTNVTSGVLSRYFPHRTQRLTPGAIRILRMRRRADTRKAQEELGYRPGSVRDAVFEAYEFFEREGMVPRGAVVSMPRASAAAE